MVNFSNKLSKLLNNNKLLKGLYSDLKISGNNPWELKLKLKWNKNLNILISSFDLSDIWALHDWWINTLNYNSKKYYPLFPDDERMLRFISNHYKNHKNHRDTIFNCWLIKEGDCNEDYDNEIIGHFLIYRINTKPELSIGISDKFQGKKLGTLFIIICISILKILEKKTFYLFVDKENKTGLGLYKKLGFEVIGESEIFLPAVDWRNSGYNMKLKLENFEKFYSFY